MQCMHEDVFVWSGEFKFVIMCINAAKTLQVAESLFNLIEYLVLGKLVYYVVFLNYYLCV